MVATAKVLVTYKGVSRLVDTSGNVYKPVEGGYTYALRDKKGVISVCVYEEGVCYTLPVARLVAMAFIPNPDPEHNTMVIHLDGNYRNNDVSNLAWATEAEWKENRKKQIIKASSSKKPQ